MCRVERTRSVSRSNAFAFSLERVWLLVGTRLASRSNAFGFSFERVQAVVGTRSYAERTRSDEKRVIPCV